MLRTGDGVSDNVLEEDLENTSSFLVNETGDSLDSSSSRESSNGGLGDSLDVVTQDLSVSLRSSFAQTLSTFSSSGHLFKSENIVISFARDGWRDAGDVASR